MHHDFVYKQGFFQVKLQFHIFGFYCYELASVKESGVLRKTFGLMQLLMSLLQNTNRKGLSVFREVFVKSGTQDVLVEGDIFKWPKLAKTLQRISKFGAQEFYSGQVAKDLVDDLKSVGSIITLQDLKNYK